MRKGRTKKGIAVIALLVLITVIIGGWKAAGTAGSPLNDSHVITIAYLPITHALPLFEAKKQIEAESSWKVKLVKYGSWPELMDALSTGRVDGASVLMELAVRAREQNIGLTGAALGHHEGNAIVVQNNISSVDELKGKKIAIPHKLSTHNLLIREMLSEHGLSPEDVTLIELSPAEMPAALKTGQISAYCVAEPFGAKAVENGFGKVLYQADDLWKDSVCCGLVFTDSYLKKQYDGAKIFTRAYSKAGKTLDASKEEELSIASENFKAPKDVLKQSLEWISFSDLHITKTEYNTMISRMKQENLTKEPPAYEEFVDNGLLGGN